MWSQKDDYHTLSSNLAATYWHVAKFWVYEGRGRIYFDIFQIAGAILENFITWSSFL